MKKSLIILSLLSCFCLVSCASLKDWAKTEAKEAATTEFGKLVSKQLPPEKQAEFDALYETSPKEALIFATETIGVDKIADQLEKADEANKELADQLRKGGTDFAKMQWAAILAALLGGGGSLFGLSRRNKWVKVARTLIKGVGAFTQSEEASTQLKAEIKRKANEAGVKPILDREVAKVMAQ